MSADRVTVREAAPDELAAVVGVIDTGLLDYDLDAVRDSVREGRALVAVEGGTIVGTVWFTPGSDSIHVEAVAVRPGSRGRGVGTALIEAVADRGTPLTAEFDGRLRPFYDRLGFRIEAIGDGRCRGVR